MSLASDRRIVRFVLADRSLTLAHLDHELAQMRYKDAVREHEAAWEQLTERERARVNAAVEEDS